MLNMLRYWVYALFGVGAVNKAPHEIRPDILHWREGDFLEIGYDTYRFISATADGYVYLSGYLSPRKFKYRLADIRHVHNRSLRDRNLDAELLRSNEYMEMLAEFRAAFEELRQRDKQLTGERMLSH